MRGQDRDGPKDRVLDRLDTFIDRDRQRESQREREREGYVERNRDSDRDGMQIFESARLRFEAQKQLWVVRPPSPLHTTFPRSTYCVSGFKLLN